MALLVLSKAEDAAGQKDAARDHLAQARKAWRGDLAKVGMAAI